MPDFSVWVVALLSLGTVVVPVVAGGVAASMLLGRRAHALDAAIESARRHGILVNAMAWLVALFGGPAVLGAGALLAFRVTAGTGAYPGLVAGLWPAGHALLFLAVHALGERGWPRPTGTVRRAALAPRGPRAPRWLLNVTLAWAALVVLAVVLGGVTADDGRRLTWAAGSAATSVSPYPGWTYGTPVLVGLVAVAASTWGVLRLVARRPAVTPDARYDIGMRQLSAHRVLRGVQLVLALTLAALLGTAAQALVTVGLVGLGIGSGVAAGAAGLGGIGTALVPARAPSGSPDPLDPEAVPGSAAERDPVG